MVGGSRMGPKTYINQILQGKTQLHLEDQSVDFKLYANKEKEPIKFNKHEMREYRGRWENQSSSYIEHQQKRREIDLRKTYKGTAVVNSRTSKSMN